MADADLDDDSMDFVPLEPKRAAPVVVRSAAAPEAAAGGPNVDPLVARLRRDADVVQAGGMTSVAGGAAICVLESLAFALIIVVLMNLWLDGSVIGFTGWTIVGLLFCGGIVGLLLKPKTPGSDSGRYVAGAPPELLERGPIDWPLLGPRLMVVGIRHANGNEPVARGYFYDRCALLLRQLGKRGEQAPLPALLISDDETPAMLGKAIGYLDKTGWLGTSSDKQRVWLSTKGRQVLMEMGVMPKTEI